MALKISRQLLDELRDRAGREPDREVCGLLLGRGGCVQEAVPAQNVAVDTRRHFEIDPAVLFAAIRGERAGGPQRLGHYHSHPRGNAVPSAADAHAAAEDGQIWIVIARPDVTAWRWSAAQGFEPVPLEVD